MYSHCSQVTVQGTATTPGINIINTAFVSGGVNTDAFNAIGIWSGPITTSTNRIWSMYVEDNNDEVGNAAGTFRNLIFKSFSEGGGTYTFKSGYSTDFTTPVSTGDYLHCLSFSTCLLVAWQGCQDAA